MGFGPPTILLYQPVWPRVDTDGGRGILFPMRIADFKSWLPLALIIIVAFLLYLAITGRCGELLRGGPPH